MCYNIIRWRKSADKKEYGSVPERPKGADCKSVVTDFGGPNPPAPTNKKGTSQEVPFLLVGQGWQEKPEREGRCASSPAPTSFPSHAKPPCGLVCGPNSPMSCLFVGGTGMAREARTRGSLSLIPRTEFISLACQAAVRLGVWSEFTHVLPFCWWDRDGKRSPNARVAEPHSSHRIHFPRMPSRRAAWCVVRIHPAKMNG